MHLTINGAGFCSDSYRINKFFNPEVHCISAKNIIMNQYAILQSNLLDIIFENRNKEYGAYTLRKSYNNRMRIALLSMAGMCLVFCLLLLKNSSAVLNLRNPDISIPEQKVSEFHKPSLPEHKVVMNSFHVKKSNIITGPPRIVDSVNINKLPATPVKPMPSLNSTGVSEINFPSGEQGAGNNSKINGAAPAPVVKINKPHPLNIAEIMPQYPGGTKALLDFLKKNLRAPEEITEGDEVSVKIKFVVNYSGKLESFDIIKSGGMAFDNEVLRVLKKMPLWIPGKSNGENVSVYYVVPVKFTSEL
jgi:periplasmic protein TonB